MGVLGSTKKSIRRSRSRSRSSDEIAEIFNLFSDRTLLFLLLASSFIAAALIGQGKN